LDFGQVTEKINFCGVYVAQSLVFCVEFGRQLLFFLLSVLHQFKVSDSPFSILLLLSAYQKSIK
jgi:hypothetical protein